MTLILAIDTSMNACSAGVFDVERNIAASRTEMMDRGQSESLMPMITDVISRAGIKFPDLDAVAVTRGPGTFTGIRVGLSAARALGMALEIPVYGLSTFDVLEKQLADQLDGTRDVAVLIETKREDYYVRCRSIGAQMMYVVMPASELLPFLSKGAQIIGDAVNRFVSEGREMAVGLKIISGAESPRPEVMAQMAAEIHESPEAQRLYPAAPVYLRAADVTKK